MTQNPSDIDKIFKAAFAGEEAELSNNLSFDAVMERRAAKQGSGFLKPLLWSSIGIVAVVAASWLYLNNSPKSQEIAGSSQNSSTLSSQVSNKATSSENTADFRSTEANVANLPTVQTNPASNLNTSNSNYTNQHVSLTDYNLGNNKANKAAGDQESSNNDKLQKENHLKLKVTAIHTENGDSVATSDKNLDIASISENANLSHHFFFAKLEGRVLKLAEPAVENLGVYTLNTNAAPIDLQRNMVLKPINDNGGNTFKLEFLVSTGRIQQAEATALSGTLLNNIHNYGYYKLQGVFDLKNQFSLGAGLAFGQNSGTADYHFQQATSVMQVDTQIIAIINPGFPTTYKTVYDTSMVPGTVNKKEKLTYSQSRFTVPVSLYYVKGTEQFALRFGLTIAPGLLTRQTGSLFAEGAEVKLAEKTNKLILDTRLGMGMLVGLNKNTNFIFEPAIQLNLTQGQSKYAQVIPGVGIGIQFKY